MAVRWRGESGGVGFGCAVLCCAVVLGGREGKGKRSWGSRWYLRPEREGQGDSRPYVRSLARLLACSKCWVGRAVLGGACCCAGRGDELGGIWRRNFGKAGESGCGVACEALSSERASEPVCENDILYA